MLETAPSTSSCKTTSRYYCEHLVQTHHQRQASYTQHYCRRVARRKPSTRHARHSTATHHRVLLAALHRQQQVRCSCPILERATPARQQPQANHCRLFQNRQTSRKRGQTIPLEHPATTTMENMDTPSPQRHRVRAFHQPENTLRHTNQQPG